MNTDHFQELAETIHALENQGYELAKPWYDFESVDESTLSSLQQICEESLQSLQQLSGALNQKLPETSGLQHHQLEHAYNIVQELSQSRAAVLEMIQSIQTDGLDYQEFYRAISLKERAAEEQTRKLEQTLRNNYH